MNEMKILHLFPKLLSLYGEYGNVAILKNALEETGYTVSVTACEDGKADFSAYDFIYVGSGTEDNLVVALDRLDADAVKASIESGKVWLATGNAMTLFGKTVRRGKQEVPGVGAFGYTTTIDDSKRFLGAGFGSGRRFLLASSITGAEEGGHAKHQRKCREQGKDFFIHADVSPFAERSASLFFPKKRLFLPENSGKIP